MEPKERGAQASAIARNPVFQEAVAATQDWAIRSFSAASTPEDAWNARLRLNAAEEFVAYLRAVVALGQSEVDRLVAERDKMSARKRRKNELANYLNEARKARAEFAESDEKVA